MNNFMTTTRYEGPLQRSHKVVKVSFLITPSLSTNPLPFSTISQQPFSCEKFFTCQSRGKMAATLLHHILSKHEAYRLLEVSILIPSTAQLLTNRKQCGQFTGLKPNILITMDIQYVDVMALGKDSALPTVPLQMYLRLLQIASRGCQHQGPQYSPITWSSNYCHMSFSLSCGRVMSLHDGLSRPVCCQQSHDCCWR